MNAGKWLQRGCINPNRPCPGIWAADLLSACLGVLGVLGVCLRAPRLRAGEKVVGDVGLAPTRCWRAHITSQYLLTKQLAAPANQHLAQSACPLPENKARDFFQTSSCFTDLTKARGPCHGRIAAHPAINTAVELMQSP